ncbi:MAG: ABC transporter permease subunit [Gemmatimonadetes bacterium]|nr:ABC transporter permease subunit [Gemmatimonadota bacterium]
MTTVAEPAPLSFARPRAIRPLGRQLAALARYELAVEMRGRILPVFAVGFALAALAVALVGMSAGGTILVQGFGRTAVSLLQLSLWVVPLVGLAVSALAAADGYDMETLAAQPIGRGTLVVGRALGRFVALGAAVAVGYGVAGVVIAGAAGTGDALRYLGLVGVAVALAAASTSLGTLAGVAARTRTRALALAVGLWFVLALGFDLAAIAALGVLPRAQLTWCLSGLLLLDPVDTARAIGVGLLGAEAIAGPMGAALRRVLGPWGLLALWVGLAAWTALPLALAARLFARRDL